LLEGITQALGPGLAAQVIVSAIRSMLNSSMKQVRPGQLVQAIKNNTSLWEVAGTDMTARAKIIPPAMINAGRPMYRKAVSDMGNATELVCSWMKIDNPIIYSLIINTPGGQGWFDEQVRDVCGKFNLEYEVKA